MKIRRFRRAGRWRRFLPGFSRKTRGFSWKKWIFGTFFLGILAIFGYGTFFLPDVRGAEQLHFAESTIIYDRGALEKLRENPGADISENILYTIHGDENREFVPLDEISPWLRQATIAIEDDGFYSHFGFDLGAIVKSGLNYVFGVGKRRGGSTITQQLVKNTFLSRERTLTRKINELLLAVKMEWNFSKDEILEMYLNKIPYGHNAHGAEAASRLFFNKSARDLTLGEAVILASLPVAPTRFSPYGANRDLLMGFYEYDEETGAKIYKKGRKDLVLQRMLDEKMISFKQFQDAFAETKNLEFTRYREPIRAPHFVFLVREKLEAKYGKEFLKRGGLRIFTTLDPDLQATAEEVVFAKSGHYPSTWDAKNVALASIDPDSGEILAYIGGKNYFDTENDGQVDVLRSRRQPGSVFKPFVYAAGFARGFSPATVLFDVETDFGGNYKPQNFDGKFAGPVSARVSLNRSLNIPAIKMAHLAGVDAVLDLTKKLGIEIDGDARRHGVALGIGVAEVEPLSLIAAYQVFAGDGGYFLPNPILEIRNSAGEILEKTNSAENHREGLDPEVSALVRHILTDESTRPTTDDFDWNQLLQLEKFNNGSKTGTSNRRVKNPDFDEEKPADDEENPEFITAPGDSWTIGFTPHLVTGVWVGNNRGEPMKVGATGLAVAAPIWKRFMDDAHAILVKKGADPAKLYNEPTPLEVRKVNKFSGKLATDLTPPKLAVDEVFASFAVPTEFDDSVKMMEIDKISGRPATEFTPFYARTQKYALVLKSARPDRPNWQNPVDDWLRKHPKFVTSLGAIFDSEDPDEILPSPEANAQTPVRRTIRDDVHNKFTQKNPPKIQILSPRNGGTLAPGVVEVRVRATARFEMKLVEFYLDDQLVAESLNAPFTGKFKIPPTANLGVKRVLRAVAIDRLLNSSFDEIEVEIARDTRPPNIIFLGPVGRQRIPLNSRIQILADVRDSGSGVKAVEFFFDGSGLGFATEPPFSKFFTARGNLGRHEIAIRAHDFHGNVAEKSIPVIFEREKMAKIGDLPEISDVISYRSSVSVNVIFPKNLEIEWTEIVAEQGDRVIFSEKLEFPPKFVQVQIPKNGGGRTKIQIFTKFAGREAVRKSPVRWAEF